MKASPWTLTLLLVLAVLAGAVGGVAGTHWLRANGREGLHSFVHRQLDLSSQQERDIASQEAGFAVRRQKLDLALQQANTDLAQAIAQEETNGPAVKASVAKVHARMGALQDATIEHLFSMRRYLTPEQRQRFDAEVTKSLTTTRQ